MRPGQPSAQREHGVGIERQNPVEARAQFAPGIGRVARAECECKAVGECVGLGVAGRVEALRLDRGIGRDAAIPCVEAIAAFDPSTVALRVEVGGQLVADGEAVVDIQWLVKAKAAAR